MSKQDEVLELSAKIWNAFLDISENEKHSDDTNDFRFHIHAIQNIMFTQKYKKEKNTFELKGSDLISIINKTNRDAK